MPGVVFAPRWAKFGQLIVYDFPIAVSASTSLVCLRGALPDTIELRQQGTEFDAFARTHLLFYHFFHSSFLTTDIPTYTASDNVFFRCSDVRGLAHVFNNKLFFTRGTTMMQSPSNLMSQNPSPRGALTCDPPPPQPILVSTWLKPATWVLAVPGNFFEPGKFAKHLIPPHLFTFKMLTMS